MKTIFYIIIISSWALNLSAQNFPFELGRAQKKNTTQEYPCEFGVNVKDNRPSNCTFDNDFNMYNVYYEEFDYREDIPNNWRFTLDYTLDDNYKSGKGRTYLGGKIFQNNDNVYCQNGVCYLEFKAEKTVNANPTPWAPNTPTKDYDFTGAFLNSFFSLRQGVFEARIKFPNNAFFWPAYWLFNVQEIDICEFWDGTPLQGDPWYQSNNCGSYHHMNMSLHGYIDEALNPNISTEGTTHCTRTRKFGVPNGFFDSFHTYKCVWTDYYIDFYLDGTRVGKVSRYYDGPFLPGGTCHESTGAYWPTNERSCNYMSNSPECQIRIWVPNFPDFWHGHYECIQYNQVKKDMTFPSTDKLMKMIISNSFASLNDNDANTLEASLGNFQLDNRRIGVDWVKIYQPIKCNSYRYINSVSDFKYYTGNTNFLSGSLIQIGNGSNTNMENYADDNFPMHVLSTDEIQISGDVVFQEGSYLRAEIIDCNNTFTQYQRISNSGEKLFLTDEEREAEEKKQIDSLMKADPAFRDSILSYKEFKDLYLSSSIKSEVDNGAINIFPNPASKAINISMTEEDYYDLYSIEVFDNLGKRFEYQKNYTLDLSELKSGYYQIKFKFTHGFIVVKSFIKQ